MEMYKLAPCNDVIYSVGFYLNRQRGERAGPLNCQINLPDQRISILLLIIESGFVIHSVPLLIISVRVDVLAVKIRDLTIHHTAPASLTKLS